MGNIFRHPNSLRVGKNSKTGNAGLLSATVIVVLLCWASESRSVGAPSSQSGKESEQTSIPRGERQGPSLTQSGQRPKTGLELSIPYGLHDTERFSQLIEEATNSSPTGSDQK